MAEGMILGMGTPKEVLRMEARLFFSVLKHARKLKEQARNVMMMDLCDVAAIPLSIENHKSMREHFMNRIYERKAKALPADDIRTAQIIGQMFRAAAPYMRGAPARG